MIQVPGWACAGSDRRLVSRSPARRSPSTESCILCDQSALNKIIQGWSCMDIKLEQPVAEASPEADMLVNKTAHFVEEWINEHKAEPRVSMPAEIVAAELADQCIADAESQGIEPDEINEEVGDLEEYIAETVLEEQRDGSGDDHGSIAPAPPAAGNGETNAQIPL
ncbi:DUF768 domain-containing protein [Mesorhizobium sp. M2A.F.Ca.ET.037.01.1.1]|uniref:DUF768 domain-containing protein n=2 Tax=Mesorhizobium TaxID=68287 RepID=UPI000FCA1901|nr:DUF768 domain-containing protein [Mesorhizobium sp. M2A.F.Ca.ET.037.01.1.1]RWX65440.1 DUF768 domain-containing protein [Mesorhizobium sp. M2A.F.Ca.ET.039.01.1.1]